MRTITTGLAVLAIAASTSGAARAGPASDAFAKCLVQSSTGRDRIVFIQWFFAALSVNPNVQSFSTATKQQRAAVTQQTAEVLQRLVVKDCRAEAIAAIRADGSSAIQTSFEVFGRTAATELMSDPAVSKEMNALGDYIDNTKWNDLLAEAKK